MKPTDGYQPDSAPENPKLPKGGSGLSPTSARDPHDKTTWSAPQWVDWLRGFFDVTNSRGSDDVKDMMLRLARVAVEPDVIDHGIEQYREDQKLAKAIIEGFGP